MPSPPWAAKTRVTLDAAMKSPECFRKSRRDEVSAASCFPRGLKPALYVVSEILPCRHAKKRSCIIFETLPINR